MSFNRAKLQIILLNRWIEKRDMENPKGKILKGLCYTPLVYQRIRRKLSVDLRDSEIENLLHKTLEETPLSNFMKRGKNFYIHNYSRGIRVTVNSNTTRVITADKI